MFKAVAIIAIIWNVFGVMSYLMHQFMTPETIAALPQNQQDFMNNIPSWRMLAFAIATFGGLFASVLLLVKKKKSMVFFALSLLGIIIGNIYDVFIVDYYKDAGISGLVLPLLIFFLGVFFLSYSKKVDKLGLLK
ncbi:MAG TPA: hypothetical protein EYP87_04265 [Flavobacteriaceae bacterium]|nr:hypothetical protein [Flavobacteriaceae bacterium]